MGVQSKGVVQLVQSSKVTAYTSAVTDYILWCHVSSSDNYTIILCNNVANWAHSRFGWYYVSLTDSILMAAALSQTHVR